MATVMFERTKFWMEVNAHPPAITPKFSKVFDRLTTIGIVQVMGKAFAMFAGHKGECMIGWKSHCWDVGGKRE
ncbi:hypothetical protein KQX54_009087 [Cotesia glomerata]|uniref:Uncharacterized protein n=1 Tax=Cotesia glomerata TaxID=32391 RepID=A0AAV7J7X4_COTGL|nr:hypothetical protein KQX54_009087 [Cotesia glomerata]